MIVHKIPQNTEEWREFKLGKIGGSSFKDVYPKTPPNKDVILSYMIEHGIEHSDNMPIYKLMDLLSPEQRGEVKARQSKKDYVYKLVAEKVARPITPNDYDIPEGQKFTMMLRGHLLEPYALRDFTRLTGLPVKSRSVIWQREDNKDSILSPDGEVKGLPEAVEVKCPDTHVIIRAWHENKYPDEYEEQVIKYFMVNEKLEVLNFVLHTDVLPALPTQVFRLKREDFENQIIEYASFEDAILRQVNQLAERLAF